VKVFWLLFGIFAATAAFAAETLPPAPSRYFNDYANVVSPGTAAFLNAELDQFERETSNQLVVVIYPSLTTDSSLEDYTQRLTDSWHVGQKSKDNGAVLFAFMAQHKLRIQVNYGLEGRLTDATSKDIISDVIAPQMRANDVDAAFREGVAAMIAATKGEYRGDGQTNYSRHSANVRAAGGYARIVFFIVFILLWGLARSRRHVVYGSRGRGGFWGGGGPWIFPGGGWGGGGGGGGGGGWGGGGGGFSGGGGSGGGGGASGGW
jgi:uncharacterized protein